MSIGRIRDTAVELVHQRGRSNERGQVNSRADGGEVLVASLPGRPFFLFLVASSLLAGGYGTTFLLADHLRELGFGASTAGAVVSVGTIATITSALVAGRVAQRLGLTSTLAIAALILAAAMVCFALIGNRIEVGYLGGLLLGVGWSVFYILAPVQVIHHLQPTARVKYLTLLSGAQMFGLGAAPLIGHAVERQVRSLAVIYLSFAAGCAVAAAILVIVRRALKDRPQLPVVAIALTGSTVAQVLRARTALPIIMIGLAACVFAGLSTFQTLYADSRALSPSTFFLVFTVITVGLRFAVASLIGRLALGRLVIALFAATLVALVLMLANQGSLLLYGLGAAIFAAGYGLTYSALNSMVVNMAANRRLPVAIASQVFTLSYFIGVFGFPYVGGSVIHVGGIDAALSLMAGMAGLNIVLAAPLLSEGHRLRRPWKNAREH